MNKIDSSEFQEFIEKKIPVFLSSDAMSIPFQTYCLGMEQNKLLIKNTVSYDRISTFLDSKNFHIQVGVQKFSASSIGSDGVDMLFPMEKTEDMHSIRKSLRKHVSASDDLRLELLNPFDQVTILKKKILDLSDSGLSIVLPFDSVVFEKDRTFEKVLIKKADQVFQKCSLIQVVYKRPMINEQGVLAFQVGLKFLDVLQNTPLDSLKDDQSQRAQNP